MLWRRALVLVIVGAVLVVVVLTDALHGALLDLLDVVEPLIDARPVVGGAFFVVLAALSAMLAFFSSAVLVPVAVQAWGVLTCVILLWAGWMLGGAGAYAVGRFLGRPVVGRLASGRLLARYEDRISRRTPFGVVLLFQLALPSEVPGYVLGLARYGFGRYLLALALAEVPFALGTVLVSESLIERRALVLLALGAGGALLSVGALRLFLRRVRR